MKYRNIAWREIDACVETVGQTIRAARFRPDCIVAILKGGLVPARLLSDFFGSIEIYPIRVKAYAEIRRPDRIRLESFRYPIGRKRVLLVDDIHDSGQSLQKVIRHLQRRRPRALRTATLFYKHNALHPPDFHARTVAPDVWVVFPWEKNEMKNAHE
ncbi:MAG: phosphoribosyltransferase [Kiritimatiellota bacterium]|nr:phosphoribosyltransferase [Kiritimatiellota bacterium]